MSILPLWKWHEDQNGGSISPRASKQDQLYSIHIHNKESQYFYPDNVEKGKGDFYDTAAIADRKVRRGQKKDAAWLKIKLRKTLLIC